MFHQNSSSEQVAFHHNWNKIATRAAEATLNTNEAYSDFLWYEISTNQKYCNFLNKVRNESNLLSLNHYIIQHLKIVTMGWITVKFQSLFGLLSTKNQSF